MKKDFKTDFENENLFVENKPGEYTYFAETSGSKYAFGSLSLTSQVARNQGEQIKAGGERRRTNGNEYGVDDGGHLIGARFGGSVGQENLTAQDRNLNRGAYKQMENEWALRLENKENVYVYIEADNVERPNSYVGYAIYENSSGERTWDVFSFTNENSGEIEAWNEIEDQYDSELDEDVSNEY